MARLRIAILCEYPTLNGGEQSLLAVLEHLDRMFDVYVLAPGEGPLSDALDTRSVTHVPFDVGRLSRADRQSQLIEACERLRPDILHANSVAMSRLTGSIAESVAAVCTGHLRDIIGLSAAAVASLNANAKLVAVSEAVRSAFIEQGVDAEKLQVIHNGVDGSRFAPRPRSGTLRRELGIPDDVFAVATIGQICLRKAQDVLAEAAALNADFLPDVHYVIVGERYSTKPESVEFERRIRERFAGVGLSNRVHWLGYRADVPDLLGEVDMLAHAARQEPLGRVLLETGAAGLPIVATQVGGTEEIFEDGESAFLVVPDDAAALASAIRTLHEDPVLRTRLGEAARRRIVRHFAVEAAAQRTAAFWEAIAERQSTS